MDFFDIFEFVDTWIFVVIAAAIAVFVVIGVTFHRGDPPHKPHR